MLDILVKQDHRRLNPIEVIEDCSCSGHFYYWISQRDPLKTKTYSLKRLAREFLSENSGYYTKFVNKDERLKEEIRIGHVVAWEK